MRILLTGGSGFVGQNLKKHLREQGYRVYAITSSLWDLRRQERCESMMDQIKPDIVVHAAGSVGGIGANQLNPGKFMYENLIMGTNVVHACMEYKVNKLIMLGTVCSYPKHTTVPFKEEDMWNGYPEETNAPYGIAKHTVVELTKHYLTQYGLNTVNLVPVNMYGPHDNFDLETSHVIPALIKKIDQASQDGTPVKVWGTGKASREFLYVKDFCVAVQKAIEYKGVYVEPINIGTGREITISQLVSTIKDQIGPQVVSQYQVSRPDGQPRRCLNTTNAREKLGFDATHSLADGLKETIAWYKENKETL